MDVTGENAALVMLTFLQADCRDAEYRKELLSLGQEINPARDINWNGLIDESTDDGLLEADGHHICNITALQDIRPSVELLQPGEFYYFNRVCVISLPEKIYKLRFTRKHATDTWIIRTSVHSLSYAMQKYNYSPKGRA